MKRCPTCQQTYPDNAPDFCPNDRTPLINDAQQQYYGGGQQQQPPPYAPQGNPPPPPQWQPPGQNWGGSYQQPGQYAQSPYGAPYAPTGGSKALSTGAFLSGLGAFLIMVVIIIFYALARNGAFDLDTLITIARILQPLSWLMLIAGVASIVLGIVSLVTAGRNPSASKPKAIIGMCLGAIPLLLFLIGLANMPS